MTAAYLPPRELRNIQRINECVYCGATSNLTREHVVPRGMGGTVTLPKGSCHDCARITQEIETTCMRQSLIHVRVQLGLHRHPKERPEGFSVIFKYKTGEEKTVQVPAADFPTMWAMPIYEYPGILRCAEAGLPVLCAHKNDANFNKLLALPNVHSVSATSGGVDIALFTRWIAKIGYCYAVASLGLDAVRGSPLVELILKGSSQLGYLIGGLNNLKREKPPTFDLELPVNEVFRVMMMDVTDSNGKPYKAVYIRLLPLLSGATYLAVVCENVQK